MPHAILPEAEMAGPTGELASRQLAMPADTNPWGHIFGGWIMALMDASAVMSAVRRADGPVVTAGVSNIHFLQPVHVGDSVCCYTREVQTGRTSITYAVEVWVLRGGLGERIKVTQAEFTFVAVGEGGQPRVLPAPEGQGRQTG
ncbi:acyl-CoA thioesterase [Limobrevibacterium gyesilva]|uniref:Acyl-CoA thioesterase n=1 Tax=Limobrevibacterium gyesilva TaxID=2991712 RepID=A0AA42CE88_9PROT|nr:acyl-CoA thioesterase [Limobrevibacterium gyesilva]MCW3475758.1 acyl-CoA thioesterase [Limobrevibacterium gyesilva]